MFDRIRGELYNRCTYEQRGKDVEMNARLKELPKSLIWIAIGQIVALLIMPPSVLASISPVIWGVVVLLFALLGWGLLRRKAWARIASIFIQGFSIIVHLLVLLPNAKAGGTLASPWDFTFIITTIASMAVSAAILYYIDQPDIQAILQ